MQENQLFIALGVFVLLIGAIVWVVIFGRKSKHQGPLDQGR